MGMAIGPIPWTAIHQYAEVICQTEDPDDYDDFLTLVRAMDDAYLEHVNNKVKT